MYTGENCHQCGRERKYKTKGGLLRGRGKVCSACKYEYVGKLAIARVELRPWVIEGETASCEIEKDGKTHRLLVSVSDLDKVNVRRWGINMDGYAVAQMKQKNTRLHTFLMDTPKGLQVDHINGNRLDNRRSNLRFVTPGQNCQNIKLRKDATSGIRGVSWWARGKKWKVQAQVAGVKYHGGYFEDKEEAERAAIDLRKKLFTHHNEERSKQ